MRGLDIALAALALRVSPTRPPKRDRLLAPAVDDADAATVDRAAIPQQRAVLIASLWPPARQCVVRPVYQLLAAPAAFGLMHCVTWRAPSACEARALQARLRAVFPGRGQTPASARAA